MHGLRAIFSVGEEENYIKDIIILARVDDKYLKEVLTFANKIVCNETFLSEMQETFDNQYNQIIKFCKSLSSEKPGHSVDRIESRLLRYEEVARSFQQQLKNKNVNILKITDISDEVTKILLPIIEESVAQMYFWKSFLIILTTKHWNALL